MRKREIRTTKDDEDEDDEEEENERTRERRVRGGGEEVGLKRERGGERIESLVGMRVNKMWRCASGPVTELCIQNKRTKGPHCKGFSRTTALTNE